MRHLLKVEPLVALIDSHTRHPLTVGAPYTWLQAEPNGTIVVQRVPPEYEYLREKGKIISFDDPDKSRPNILKGLPRTAHRESLTKFNLSYADPRQMMQVLPGYVFLESGTLPEGNAYSVLKLEIKALEPLELTSLTEQAKGIFKHVSGFQFYQLAVETDAGIYVSRKDVARGARTKLPFFKPGKSLDVPVELISDLAAVAEPERVVATRYCPHGVPLATGLAVPFAQTPHASARGAHASYR